MFCIISLATKNKTKSKTISIITTILEEERGEGTREAFWAKASAEREEREREDTEEEEPAGEEEDKEEEGRTAATEEEEEEGAETGEG